MAMRQTKKQLEVLKRELAEVSRPAQKLRRSIVVELEVLRPGSFNLEVSYRVADASWYPVYDARVNFSQEETELISFAAARQNTGEDWQDVAFSLSTARIDLWGALPEIEPWVLSPSRPSPTVRYPFVKEKQYRMRMAEGDLVVKAPEALEQKADYAYSQQEERGVSLVYKLARPATVKSGVEGYKLPLFSQNLSSAFFYSAYPRLSSFAYLTTKVTNAKDLQLLAGRVNVFLDGDFVGTSQIKNIAGGETFELYLGADENVKVKRELLEKRVDETLIAAIAANTKKILYRYKITVENYKSKDINVKIFEATPVSADDRIRVKIEKVSPEPSLKDYQDKKGIWVWEFLLKPQEKKEIFYSYSVEHPREMDIEG